MAVTTSTIGGGQAVARLDTGWINVVADYGADNTGATDCTAAIQAAVDAAYAATDYFAVENYGTSINRRYAPKVFFPHGTYLLDDAAAGIVLNAVGQNIEWEGDRATIICGENFDELNWAVSMSTHTQVMTSTMFVRMKGMNFIDFRRTLRLGNANNNINLGEMIVEDCHFAGRDQGDSIGIQIYNRSESCIINRCQFDNLNVFVDTLSCDRVYITDCRGQIRAYMPSSERSQYHGYFVVRRGAMYITRFTGNPLTTSGWTDDRSYAVGDLWRADVTDDDPNLGLQLWRCKQSHTPTEGVTVFDSTYASTYWDSVESYDRPLAWCKAEDYEAWATGTQYAVGDVRYGDVGSGTDLLVCIESHTASASQTTDAARWAAVDDTDEGSLSVWCEINVRDSLFGGEGGGHPVCIWNIDAADANPTYPRGFSIADSIVNTDAKYGAETIQYQSGLYTQVAPILVLVKIPNKIYVDNVKAGQTYLVAADYLRGITPPTPWVATQTKPLEVHARGVECSTFHNYSPSGGQLWKYSPNWVPADLAVPTLTVNDISPFWPANCKVAQTANTSATTISLFYGVVSGQEVTLHITDANTTIADGTYIKLAGSGSWTPGVGGGSITFYAVDGAVYEKSRTDFQ